ncbi:MAG: hypothetical protein NTW50_02110 [Candidatus Berkelbacteria bacterium]|nr:hypothetical protein [Candidatus Berkelbacteria bacterium]
MNWAKCFSGIRDALLSVQSVMAIIGIEEEIFQGETPFDCLSAAFVRIRAADGGLRGGQGPPILMGTFLEFVTELRAKLGTREDLSDIPDWAMACYYAYEAIEMDEVDINKSEEWLEMARTTYRRMYRKTFGESRGGNFEGIEEAA